MNINSFNNYISGNDPQGSAHNRMKALWGGFPIFVKIVLTLTVIFYILSWPFENFVNLFVKVPAYIVLKFNKWRIVTSVFVTLNLLNIIFSFISWIPDAIRLENKIGTVKYAMNFLLNSILINIFYIVVMCIFAPIFGKGATNG
jgi:membrane associated rhomboid family serine protease